MTPEEAIARLDMEWRRFAGTPEYYEKMVLAQEIAIADAEAPR